MAQTVIYSQEAAIQEATDIQTVLVASKMRLFDNTLVPTVLTVKADMVAVETTLTGYPAGGYALAAWGAPQAYPGGGYSITSPMQAVDYAAPGGPFGIGGGWVEDAAGKVRAIFVFDPAYSLAAVGDGFQWVMQLVYGRNSP